MKTPRFKSLALAALAGAAAFTAGLSDAPVAKAQVAARVEAQTRPNFGLLLSPQAGYRLRTHRRFNYRDHRPDWRDYHGYGPGYRPGYGPSGGEQQVFVDCGGNPGSGAVEDAVRRVAPGGTLTIRDRGGACVGWLNVDKPMTIQGEGGYDPRTGARVQPARLQAPDGLPCISAGPAARVLIQDIVLLSPNGGDAACVVGDGATIQMSRVAMRHVGDEAAIYVKGGLLDIRDSSVDASTTAAGIVADDSSITAANVIVSNAVSGIEIIPGAGQPSVLYDVTLTGQNTPNNFGPRAIGVVVRSRRDLGRVEITNAKICGYVEGVVIEGASVAVKDSKICKSDKGVVLYSGEVTLTGSRVRAKTYGVGAASGRAVVNNNVFAGVDQVFYQEDRAVVQASNNRVWSQGGMCRPQFRPRYRERYEPNWNSDPNSGYTCQISPYPQSWWAEEDGSLGMPYVDDGYAPTGYDYFQSGYGWYDRDGGYVRDNQYWGDERWGQRIDPRTDPRRQNDRYRDDRRDDRCPWYNQNCNRRDDRRDDRYGNGRNQNDDRRGSYPSY